MASAIDRPSQGPGPERIFETLNAYQKTAALKTAIELDVFTAISQGTNTAATLAQKCQASERGIRNGGSLSRFPQWDERIKIKIRIKRG